MLERIEHDGSREAYVLAGMVFSSTVLSRLASLPERHWSSKASGYIADLCCRCWENILHKVT